MWNGSIDTLLQKIRRTGTIDRQPGSVHVNENIEDVEDPVLSQNAPSICEISRETGIHRLTVHRIIRRDLQLKCVKRRHCADSAPAQCARRDTIQLLQRETPDFIGPDLWPPNSPDLNTVDYKIWWVVQQRVYKCCVSNVDELK